MKSTLLKHIICGVLTVIALAAPSLNASAQEQLPATYFPYPTIPDNLTMLDQRTGYLVEHFWERCNLKNAFSSRAGMASAFKDYISFMPHAPLETVNTSIDRFLKALKKHHEVLAYITELAEQELYSDSAQYWSDDLFLKFLNAGVGNKKISKDKKAYYQKLISRLSQSKAGMKIPDMTLTLADGNTKQIADIIDSDTASITILYFNNPSAPGESLNRLRLDADSRLNNFIDDGSVKLIAITPTAANEDWKKEASSMPGKWIVGASQMADERYDIRSMPSFYILDRSGVIHYKNLLLEQLIDLLYKM